MNTLKLVDAYAEAKLIFNCNMALINPKEMSFPLVKTMHDRCANSTNNRKIKQSTGKLNNVHQLADC